MQMFGSASNNSTYSLSERVLHRFALDIPWISKASFDLDVLMSRKNVQPTEQRHLFICGLARSGTTVLLRSLDRTGQFRSLTYRDMPFVLMPNIWDRLTRSFHGKTLGTERAHGDGLFVDTNSPEAFEEVFWRTFSGRNYILSDRLVPYDVENEVIHQFRSYVALILISSLDSERKRYLSKNNNNVLRLNSIQKAFPSADIIIPFRDPIQQAASLMEQHIRFSDRHKKDRFAYNYMRWLGHHEFGLTHKPFKFDFDVGGISYRHRVDNIHYWLSLWNSTYAYLLGRADKSTVFICYEDLCEPSGNALESLLQLLEVPVDAWPLENSFSMRRMRQIDGIDQKMESLSKKIYEELRSRSCKIRPIN